MARYFPTMDGVIAIAQIKLGRVVVSLHTVGQVSFRYTERSNGTDTAIISLRTTNWFMFDQFLSGLDGNGRLFEIRFGYENTRDTTPKTVLSSWRAMRVSKYDISYVGETANIEIIAENMMAALNDDQKLRAFPDARISEIVSGIAEEYKLTPNDETDIEETADTTLGTWLQTHLTDLQFVRHYLMPRTESGVNTAQYQGRVQGRTDYAFFCRDGKEIVFRPPNYNLTEREVWRYPALNAQDTVLSVGVSWFEPVVRAVGGDTYAALGYSLVSKVPYLTLFANEETTPEKVRLAKYADPVPDVVRREFPVSRQGAAHVSISSREHWSRYAQKNYMLVATVVGDPLLRVLDTIYLDLRAKNANDKEIGHYMRGKYLLSEVDHTIVGTRYQSLVKMYRRHVTLGEDEGVGQKKDAQQLTASNSGNLTQGKVKKSRGA